MLKLERKRIIENELKKSGSILISDISILAGCSEETIRRDLKEMEKDGKLKRVHGGAFLPETDDKGIPIKLREKYLPKEKQMLAEYITDNLINENDTIMLDSSTTCLSLAKSILARGIRISIITNSLRILTLFNETPQTSKLICIGGHYRKRMNSFIGYPATIAVSQYLADKSFISCSAVDPVYGLLDNNMDEGQVRKAMLEHSKKRYLIVDHTKLSDRADYIIGDLSMIDEFITDIQPNSVWTDKLHSLEIILHCAESKLERYL